MTTIAALRRPSADLACCWSLTSRNDAQQIRPFPRRSKLPTARSVECREVYGQAMWTAVPRDGAPSCVTTRQTSPPWTYSLFQPLALICSTAWSSSGWRAEILSGSMSHLIRLRNGSRARSRRHSLGLRLRATPVDGLQIHGAGWDFAFARLEDISSKPRAGDRRH